MLSFFGVMLVGLLLVPFLMKRGARLIDISVPLERRSGISIRHTVIKFMKIYCQIIIIAFGDHGKVCMGLKRDP